VLHSGVYYKPGSLKALNCRAGRAAMLEFCEREGLPTRICGKVIVAVSEDKLPRLDRLYERAQANGVACEPIGRERLAELEPHADGIRAVYLPQAGIVDFKQICERLAQCVREKDQRVLTRARVIGLRESAREVVAQSTAGDFTAQYVVNCAGLHSDRVTVMVSPALPARIVPFRGEYYRLKPEAEHLCNALIYPVADPRFPFLGVHFTRMISGEVECGPNAVLAFAREGYRKADVSFRDLAETLKYPGFWRMAGHYWRMGIGEMWRSFSKAAFVKALQHLMPEVTADHLVPAQAGIRAQAVAPDGSMLDDFAFLETARVVNVINAPSPAATAALSIGNSIAEKLFQRMGM
jgi:L-2-hydroxyglutarate oxidase